MRDAKPPPFDEEPCVSLFSNEAMRADLFGQMDSDKIAFVFNNIVEHSSGLDKGPTRFLRREGFSIIRFVSSRLDWHQNIPQSVISELEVQAQLQRSVKRIAVGHSMGAFAAIALSQRLCVDISIAFAPQYNPARFPDYRFSESLANVDDWRYLINNNSISKNCFYYLVYDSRDLDARHAAAIRQLIQPHNLLEIKIPHATHEITGYLQDIGQLKFLTRELIGGETPNIRRLRADRILSPRYVTSLSTRLSSELKMDQLLALKACLVEIHARTPHYCSSLADTKWTSIGGESFDTRMNKNVVIIDRAIRTCADMICLLAEGFDEEDYNRRYTDIARAQMRAVYHYVVFGRAEGRLFTHLT